MQLRRGLVTLADVLGAIAGDANTAYQMPGTAGSADGFRVRVPFQSQWNQTGPYSVEFWAKPGQNATLASPAASVEFIASPVQRNGWLIYQGDNTLATGNGWVFRQYNSTGLANQTGASANMPINVNHWYHLVVVYDKSTIMVYVNGVYLGSAFWGGDMIMTPGTFSQIGTEGSYYFNGVVDEMMLFITSVTDPATG